MFKDGIKAYGFNFIDKEELPLPYNAFETVRIGKNMRGLISDVNIYSNYFDEKTMVKWTTGCHHPPGDIFAWSKEALNITQEEESLLNVTIISMDQREVCPDPSTRIQNQKPAKSGGSQNERRRFKPQPAKLPFIGSVLEIIPGSNFSTDPDGSASGKGPQLFSFFFFFPFSSRRPLLDWLEQIMLYSHWSTQTGCSKHAR